MAEITYECFNVNCSASSQHMLNFIHKHDAVKPNKDKQAHTTRFFNRHEVPNYLLCRRVP